MNIVYYSSDLFSEMCGVSIESLCANNNKAKNIDIYIVENNISNKNKKRLQSITSKYKRDIHFIPMPSQKSVYPGVKVNLGHTYARMAIGEILPQNIDRVLSLDSDTLVLDDITSMYETNFSENEYVAGVYDCVGKAIQKDVLHCEDDTCYCNAGMFLIDLKKWRSNKIGEKLVDTLTLRNKNHSAMFFLEQDVMNLTFYHHIKLLDPRYNMLTSIYSFTYAEVIKMKRPVQYYSKDVINKAKSNPAIIHGTTCFYIRKRIWIKNSDHPFANEYVKYRNETLWRNDPQLEDTRSFGRRVRSELWHIIPRKCAVELASFMINYIRPKFAKITNKMKISTIAKQS